MGRTVLTIFRIYGPIRRTGWSDTSYRTVRWVVPCFEFWTVVCVRLWRLPAHEIFGGMCGRGVAIVFGQSPFASVARCFETECPPLGADNESAIFENFEIASGGVFGDVQGFGTLAHRIRNATVVMLLPLYLAASSK